MTDQRSSVYGLLANRDHSIDLVRAAGYELQQGLGDVAGILTMMAQSTWFRLARQPDKALTSYGHAVRHNKLARESLTTYRVIRKLVESNRQIWPSYHADNSGPERFVFFIGYSRSGHSLVGSLIDAHPDAVISHEIHALRMLQRGAALEDVISAMRYNAALFAQHGRGYNGYDYQVAEQSQGAARKARLIGDKKANGTTALLRRQPEFFRNLIESSPVPISVIHVIRNPFDNIASRARRVGVGTELASEGYLINVDVISQLKARYPGLVIDVHLDDLIDQPKETLANLLMTLGLSSWPEGYLEDCAGIVFKTPQKPRDEVDWEPRLVSWLRSRLSSVDYLARYADAEL